MWFGLEASGPLGVLAVRLADRVPALLFAFHGGLLADRLERRRTMIVAQPARSRPSPSVVEEPKLEHAARVEAVDPEDGAGGIDGGPRRHEPHKLAADDLRAAGLSLRDDALDDQMKRRGLPVGDVHAHLDEPGTREIQPERADSGKPAVTLAHEAGDVARDLDVARAQIDVESDQRPADSEEDGARARMKRLRAEVGPELSRGEATLKLVRSPPTEERRLAPVVGETSVEEDGEIELGGDPLAERERSRSRDRLLLGAKRDEGDDVRGSYARVSTHVAA
jgi:hypothetical protein